MGMRIDEFSNPSSWDGALDSTEQTSFLLFGFNLQINSSIPYQVEFVCAKPTMDLSVYGRPQLNEVC